MPDHLIFQLTTALGSMGELAGHERRGSLTLPGRSALIGLMAAAMGIRRDGDFSALDALSIAVALFQPGEVLRDFHTVETVPSAAARRPQSRPDALRQAQGRSNVTITLRDYRCGPLYGVAVWGGDLPALADALRRPVFVPYLGRKSCPLAAPLDPRIVAADGPEQALSMLRLPSWHQGATARIMARDAAEDDRAAVTRHDIASDRGKWHFSPRRVAMVPVGIAPATATGENR